MFIRRTFKKKLIQYFKGLIHRSSRNHCMDRWTNSNSKTNPTVFIEIRRRTWSAGTLPWTVNSTYLSGGHWQKNLFNKSDDWCMFLTTEQRLYDKNSTFIIDIRRRRTVTGRHISLKHYIFPGGHKEKNYSILQMIHTLFFIPRSKTSHLLRQSIN